MENQTQVTLKKVRDIQLDSKISDIETHLHKCETCFLVLSSKSKLERHVMQLHQTIERVKCDTCEETFSCSDSLGLHIQVTHSKTENNDTETNMKISFSVIHF